MADREDRIVITGIGVIMASGVGKEELWSSCIHGESGIGEIKSFNDPDFPIGVAGEISDDLITQLVPEEKLDKVDRFSALAMIAAKEALEDSGLDPASQGERIGVYMGSCYSGRKSIDKQNAALYRGGARRVHPRLMQNNITNAASGEVAIFLRLKGANLAYSVGYSSGSYALVQAFNALKVSPLEAVLAGGAEAPILPLVLQEIAELGEITLRKEDPSKICCPFDKKREGLVAAEGSCVVVLERLTSALSRGAHIYAELKGYGIRYDRDRRIQDGRRTEEMARTIRAALEDAKISPEAVDYINASGLSTSIDDVAETQAIKEVFDDHAMRLAVSSIKPITGYAIAASEVLEVAICALSFQRGMIPPTMNLIDPDEECDLDYVPNKARTMGVNVAMSNSFGIDGNYTSIILERLRE